MMCTSCSIHKYASCSKECFILALVYIDRLIQRNSFLLTDLNVHRVVVTAVLLAAKFFDDAYYNNAYYAKVGGVLVSEMNALEVEFLFKIDFGLRVPPEVFERYRAELLSHSSAVEMDRISHCTDEELFRGAAEQALPPAMAQHQQVPVQVPQAPLLQTYSQEYPVQELQHSVMASSDALTASSSSQMQVSQHQQVPFPPLAPHVSPPGQNPAALDLVYHAGVALQHPPPASLAQVYAPLPELPSQPPAAPQALAYAPPPGPQLTYYAAPTIAMPQEPAYVNPADYQLHAALLQQSLSTNLQQSHPEITPSPPPQPVALHGAPVCLAYPEGTMGCSSALMHQPQQQYYTTASATASRPIAIAGNHQIAKDQEHHGGSWSRMVTFEGRGDSA